MLEDFQEYYDGEDCKHNLHIDPIFQTFLCPFTKEIMQDPVIIYDGRTFEREAILIWLSECNNLNEENSIISDLSYEKLKTSNLIPNIALCNTIKEWSRRNETARLNLAQIALSPESLEIYVLEALDRIQDLCTKNKNHINNKYFVRKIKLIPKIVDRFRSQNRDIRCKALETLLVIVTDDDENKVFAIVVFKTYPVFTIMAKYIYHVSFLLCWQEAVAMADNEKAIRTMIKFLIQEFSEEKLAAINLLYELSKSESLSEKIGEVDGSIMILIRIVNNDNAKETSVVEKAKHILNNLEKCEKNVLSMAENGRFEPLFNLFLQGQIHSRPLY